MALYHCNTCDNPVAEDAVRCPHCGTSAPADSLSLLGGLLGFKNTPFEKEESYSTEPEQSNYGPSHEEQSNYGPSHEEHQRLVDELIELKAEKRAREIIEAEQKKKLEKQSAKLKKHKNLRSGQR